MKYPRFVVVCASAGIAQVILGIYHNLEDEIGGGVVFILFAILIAFDVPRRLDSLLARL